MGAFHCSSAKLMRMSMRLAQFQLNILLAQSTIAAAILLLDMSFQQFATLLPSISLMILFACSFKSKASFVIDVIHWSRISFEWAICLAISARSSIFFVIVVI